MSDKTVEEKLLALTSGKKVQTVEEVEVEVLQPAQYKDIEDVVEGKFDRLLTQEEYLILTTVNDKGMKTACDEFKKSELYIKKLMRSDTAREYMKQLSEKKSETALALATGTLADGVIKYQQVVNELLSSNDPHKMNLAFSYLFGKQSLLEVQQTMFKQAQGQVTEEGDGLKSLFTSLLSDSLSKSANG